MCMYVAVKMLTKVLYLLSTAKLVKFMPQILTFS